MPRSKWLMVGILTLAWPSLAGAASYVLGDSIGEGVSIASGVKGFAKIGIHIRGPKALEQIGKTPPGSTVFIFLGTNDADGSIQNIGKSIDDVVAAAERRALSVVWAGPPCVRRAWDTRSRDLDQILRVRLASTSVKYVSMRDSRICSGVFQEPDGVHLKMPGYRYMWEKVLGATSSSATVVAGTPAAKGSADSGSTDATGSTAPAAPLSPPQQVRDDTPAAAHHRLVMEVHVPVSPSGPLIWLKSSN
jgi:lysophospholipase L1-like esterase